MTLKEPVCVATDSAIFSDDPPPNRVYAAKHRSAIRFHEKRGMSRRMLTWIYGRIAVSQVLDGV